MQKILFTLFCVSVLFSCNNDSNKYEKNLEHFKTLIKDINTYFIDSTQDTIDISDYYTEDFIFYSYPAGHKKGVGTNRSDYIANLNQMKKMNLEITCNTTRCVSGSASNSWCHLRLFDKVSGAVPSLKFQIAVICPSELSMN